MEKKETAEQKLLKIIESSSGAQAPAAPAPGSNIAEQIASSVKSTGMPSISLTSLLAPLANLFGGKLASSVPTISFGISEFNKILLGGVALTAIIFFVNLSGDMRIMREKVDFATEAKARTAEADESFLPQVKQISDYLGNIQRRNIFMPFEKKAVVQASEEVVEMQAISVVTKNLKLVGISWIDSADSAQALIEDTQSGVTYFLKVGEKIGDVTLKAIFADRIIFSYQKEELVVKL
ncbi:MAG TPA: type II secretion system protein N [Candidatus Omnitrophota bacterium]|nr:type II secretion system protein N [Candidatus Omnitrophota bacterium]HPD85126.1 type II secretion system protein N [Candidatus Omnitrophota bacterium]HRZ03984.1 type II secretion system protein N [Candidatus Omnitrophota bacterium]